MNKLSLTTYLFFNGNCREAMTFYKEILDAELEIMNFEGAPMEVSEGEKNKVMHSTLKKDDIVIMASDSNESQKVTFGNNFSLSFNCTSREQVQQLYNRLLEGGTVTMPLQDTFWGAYFGMLTDKFGVNWMFNYDAPTA